MLNKYFYITLLILNLLISAYFIRSTVVLYSAKNRVYEAEKKLQDLQRQSGELKQEIEYRKSDDYIIKEAREKLNYGFSGEEIIIVPRELTQNKSLAKDALQISESPVLDNSSKTENTKYHILKMWFEAFF